MTPHEEEIWKRAYNKTGNGAIATSIVKKYRAKKGKSIKKRFKKR